MAKFNLLVILLIINTIHQAHSIREDFGRIVTDRPRPRPKTTTTTTTTTTPTTTTTTTTTTPTTRTSTPTTTTTTIKPTTTTTTLTTTTSKKTTTTTTTPEPTAPPLQPSECDDRKIGTVHPLQYPYVVKIFYTPLKKIHRPIKCTGSVYNENWINTSAECALPSLRRKKGKPTHDYGDFWFGSEVTNCVCKSKSTAHVRYVIDVAVSPEVEIDKNGQLVKGKESIALLKANKALQFNPLLKAIEVPTTPQICPDAIEPVMFGALTDVDKFDKGYLHRIELNLQKTQVCENVFKGPNSNEKFCAKLRNPKDFTCAPDNGGPLVKLILKDLYQAPVPLFHAIICGVLVQPASGRSFTIKNHDYYVKINKYTSWIKKVAGSQNKNHFVDVD